MAARIVIHNSTTTGTVAVGAKSIQVRNTGAGSVIFNGYILPRFAPEFKVESPPTKLFPAITFDGTGSSIFIVAVYTN